MRMMKIYYVQRHGFRALLQSAEMQLFIPKTIATKKNNNNNDDSIYLYQIITAPNGRNADAQHKLPFTMYICTCACGHSGY